MKEGKSMDKTYIDAEKISDMLGVSKITVYRMFKLPGCPAIKIGARYIVEGGKFFKWLENYEGKTMILK